MNARVQEQFNDLLRSEFPKGYKFTPADRQDGGIQMLAEPPGKEGQQIKVILTRMDVRDWDETTANECAVQDRVKRFVRRRLVELTADDDGPVPQWTVPLPLDELASQIRDIAPALQIVRGRQDLAVLIEQDYSISICRDGADTFSISERNGSDAQFKPIKRHLNAAAVLAAIMHLAQSGNGGAV